MKISIENIIKKMPDGLTELEKTRYIYLEITKILTYDVGFKYSKNNLKEEEKMHMSEVEEFYRKIFNRLLTNEEQKSVSIMIFIVLKMKKLYIQEFQNGV